MIESVGACTRPVALLCAAIAAGCAGGSEESGPPAFGVGDLPPIVSVAPNTFGWDRVSPRPT